MLSAYRKSHYFESDSNEETEFPPLKNSGETVKNVLNYLFEDFFLCFKKNTTFVQSRKTKTYSEYWIFSE